MFEAFFILGLTIIVGYAALYIADRYKISQVLILMLFGFVLGPALGIVETGEGSLIRSIYPFMAVLALIILLFDGGLSFNIFNVFRTLTKSTLFTFFAFFLSMVFTLALVPLLKLSVMDALMVGAVLGGTSSAIVIAMAEKTGASDETKSLLTIESTLTDTLVIIVVFILVQAAKTLDFSLGDFANSLLSSFAISILFGIAGAFAWNFILQKIPKHTLDYMLTVAALFITYSLTEAVKANGALAVFVFGLVFGNLKNIPPSFFSISKYKMDEKIKDFQSEVTFFTRTFFFAYIGMLFPLGSVTFGTISVSVLLVCLFIIARYIADRLVLKDDEKYERGLIIPMLPRGLAAAVVVGVIISNGISIPHLQEIVFSVIFLTNIIATFAVYAYHNGLKHKPDVLPESAGEDETGAAEEEHQKEKTRNAHSTKGA
ncbi:MAG: cation:proton antiporter [Candidatus ainarchaeum sp.]|nr:cation:proton antiporter [Candidatus ainarchaeum sp.]